MPLIEYSGSGGGRRQPGPMSDDERNELWQWCLRETRPDPRLYRRSRGGLVSSELQEQNQRDYERAKEQAHQQAVELFEQRLRGARGGAGASV